VRAPGARARDPERRRSDPAYRLQDRHRRVGHHRGHRPRRERDLAAAHRARADGRGGSPGRGGRLPQRALPRGRGRSHALPPGSGVRLLPGRRRALDPDPLEPASSPRGRALAAGLRGHAGGGRGRGGEVDRGRYGGRLRGRGAAHRHGALARGVARAPARPPPRGSAPARDPEDRRLGAGAGRGRTACALGGAGARPHPRDRGSGLRPRPRRVRRRRAAGDRAAPAERAPAGGGHRSRQALGLARSAPEERPRHPVRPRPRRRRVQPVLPAGRARPLGPDPGGAGAPSPRHRLRHAVRLRSRGAVAGAPRLRDHHPVGQRPRARAGPARRGRLRPATPARAGGRSRHRLPRGLRRAGRVGAPRARRRQLPGPRVARPDRLVGRRARPRVGPRHRRSVRGGCLRPADTPFGRLRHVVPAARLSETAAFWSRPTVPPGTHPAVWPAAPGSPQEIS
jgi:hypothetical protein